MELILQPGEKLSIRVNGGLVFVESSERTARVIAYPESGMQANIDRFYTDPKDAPNATTNIQVSLIERPAW